MKPFTVKMDPFTKAQITRLLEVMTIDFEPILAVRPDWFPRKEGEAMFRVVYTVDGERLPHYFGVPADFRFELPDCSSNQQDEKSEEEEGAH